MGHTSKQRGRQEKTRNISVGKKQSLLEIKKEIIMTQPQQIQMSQDSVNKANNCISYSTNLINMSLQQLWNIAYQAGFEDAQAIMKTDQGIQQ